MKPVWDDEGRLVKGSPHLKNLLKLIQEKEEARREVPSFEALSTALKRTTSVKTFHSMATYYGRQENGLCVDCGVTAAEEGKIRCTPCNLDLCAYQRQYYHSKSKGSKAAKRKLWREAGCCFECGEPTELKDGKPLARCPRHGVMDRARKRRWHARQKEEKLQTCST